MTRRRLDTLLVERGFYESRSRAAAAVLAGDVRVGAGARAPKPGDLVAGDVPVEVAEGPRYVSRGGTKLANALEAFGIDPAGRRCLDLGASTGGFTDVLLERGAAAVVAVDVGYGALHWRLRTDPRVVVLERTNVRALRPDALPYRAGLIVADLSFISLRTVLAPALACAAERFDMLAMVKPQFEAGRERVGRGGVVRSPEVRREALVAVAAAARGLGCAVLGFASSGLAGPAGNQESFAWLAEGDRAGALADLEAAARRVEP